MTPLLDLDAALSEALHADADSTVLVGDGLTRIRARMYHPTPSDLVAQFLSFVVFTAALLLPSLPALPIRARGDR